MLQFLLNTPKLFHHYWFYKYFYKISTGGKYKIANFAGPLKNCLSALIGIPVEKFEDRDFKENYYIDFNTLNIYHVSKVPDDKILNDKKFSRFAKNLDPLFAREYYLSIRQVLQYVGTEILRTFLSDTIFINGTFKTLPDNAIIGDLRFKIEKDISILYGCKIIYIDRNICTASSHDSEQQVLDIFNNNEYDYFIDNNGTLKQLFNNIKKTVYGN